MDLEKDIENTMDETCDQRISFTKKETKNIFILRIIKRKLKFLWYIVRKLGLENLAHTSNATETGKQIITYFMSLWKCLADRIKGDSKQNKIRIT